MSNDSETWQWVDEDPIEKLIGAPKRSPASFPEPLRFEEAAVCHSAALPAGSSDPAEHVDLAVRLQESEQWEAAAKSFRRVIEMDPGHGQALIGLGACLLYLHCAEEALASFDRCLSSDAERERALFGKAVALQELARYEEADRVYRELLQITPHSTELLANLIALSVTRRDTQAVIGFSRRLLRIDPRSKAALQGLATQAFWNGDRAAAIDYCTRLVDVEPACFEGWFNLGFAKQGMPPSERAMWNPAASGPQISKIDAYDVSKGDEEVFRPDL